MKEEVVTVPQKEMASDSTKATWGPISALLLTVGSYFAAIVASGVVIGLGLSLYIQLTSGKTDFETLSHGTTLQFLTGAVAYLLMILPIWFFLKRRKFKPQMLGVIKPKWVDIAYALAGWVVYYVALILILSQIQRLFPGLDLDKKQDIGFQQATGVFQLSLVFISLVLIPPIIEEIICRGFLYGGLKTKLPIWLAAIVTSLVFGLAHLEFGRLVWAAAIDTLILSFVLIYLREKTGGLTAPILVHVLKNGLAFFVIFVLHIA